MQQTPCFDLQRMLLLLLPPPSLLEFQYLHLSLHVSLSCVIPFLIKDSSYPLPSLCAACASLHQSRDSLIFNLLFFFPSFLCPFPSFLCGLILALSSDCDTRCLRRLPSSVLPLAWDWMFDQQSRLAPTAAATAAPVAAAAADSSDSDGDEQRQHPGKQGPSTGLLQPTGAAFQGDSFPLTH